MAVQSRAIVPYLKLTHPYPILRDNSCKTSAGARIIYHKMRWQPLARICRKIFWIFFLQCSLWHVYCLSWFVCSSSGRVPLICYVLWLLLFLNFLCPIQWHNQNGILVTLRTPRKYLKKTPSIASKIGATLKGKKLLPEGANSFL